MAFRTVDVTARQGEVTVTQFTLEIELTSPSLWRIHEEGTMLHNALARMAVSIGQVA